MNEKLERLYRQYLDNCYVAPDTDRIPFEIDDCVVGSVTAQDARLLSNQVPGVEFDADSLQVLPVCAPDAPAALEAIALALRDANRLPGWRNEHLPVCADDGTQLGRVERACVRVLGIRTFAVHLIGSCHEQDGEQLLWLQRRAPDKAVDPGMLDTLTGGLIGTEADGMMEALDLGLQREVSEEAGLQPSQYVKPERLQTWRLSTPVPGGYMIEDCTVYHSRLNPGVQPVNQDGEVSEFMRISHDELLDRIDAGELTYTASAASLIALRHLA